MFAQHVGSPAFVPEPSDTGEITVCLMAQTHMGLRFMLDWLVKMSLGPVFSNHQCVLLCPMKVLHVPTESLSIQSSCSPAELPCIPQRLFGPEN